MATKEVNKVKMPRKIVNLPARLAARNNEVRPVGAWVQPESRYIHQSYEAVISAEQEEQRMREEYEHKQQRLAEFQHEVRKRVVEIEKVKRLQQLQKSYKAVEIERHVLQQSVLAAERTTPRKNRCSIRDESDLAIRRSATVSASGNKISKEHEDQSNLKTFQEQTNQIQQYHKQARHKLISRRIMTADIVPTDLPGGAWKSGSCRDQKTTDDNNGIALDLTNPEYEEAHEGEVKVKEVYFDLDQQQEETRHDRILRKSASELAGDQVERAPVAPALHYGLIPDIYPGIVTEEERQRAVNQRAMYRRLFMDIEREQVKENLRRKEHRRKIAKLKLEKEDERRLQEEASHVAMEPRDPMTGETEAEVLRREEEAEESLRSAMEQQQFMQQRNKETHRYLEALKANLREKIEKRGLELPSMCCCGTTVWDTNPDTCANNCIYYRNPRAYAKALQSLLTSCDVL